MFRALPLAALLLLPACGQQQPAAIELSNAWARPTIGQTPGAVYVTIDNEGGSADKLIGVSTDRAAMAMVHLNQVENGVARMRMAGEIEVPEHGKVEMQPGGTHVMLEGLRAPLKAGDQFDLALRFQDSGAKVVKVTVSEAEGQ